MKDYFALLCVVAPAIKAVLSVFGYHAADPFLDQIIGLCAGSAGLGGGVYLAKSDRFVR